MSRSTYSKILVALLLCSIQLGRAGSFDLHSNLGFIPNVGQVENEEITHYSKNESMRIYFLKDNSITYQLLSSDKSAIKVHNIKLEFLNSNRVIPQQLMPGQDVSYFYSNGQYQTKTSEQLLFKNIYQNIDLLYYKGTTGEFKYDFIVRPGGNPHDIKIKYSGQNEGNIINGAYQISTEIGDIIEKTPISYLKSNKEVIQSNYAYSNEILTFDISDYNQDETLVIDPEIVSNIIIGGNDDDFVESMVTDADNNILIAGHTNSDNIPITTGAFQETKDALKDAYIAKVNEDGDVDWATFFGSDENDEAKGISIDLLGNVYVAGFTEGAVFPSTISGEGISEGGNDLFLAKLSNDGMLLFSSLYGGSSDDEGVDISVDALGNIYVLGSTASEFFPSQNPISGNGADVVLMKFDPLFNLTWSSYFGGATGDEAFSLVLDNEGAPIVTGRTASESDLVIGSNIFQSNFGGVEDAFIAKFDGLTGDAIWSTYLGGDAREIGFSIVADNDNNYYVAGYTASENFPTQEAFQSEYGGGEFDGFLTKITDEGEVLWSTYYGGSQRDEIISLTVNDENQLFLAGNTESTDLPTNTSGTLQANQAGQYDVFLSLFTTNGNHSYSTYYGGSEGDYSSQIALVDNNTLLLSGYTESEMLADNAITNYGGTDIFISEIFIGDLGCILASDENTITLSEDTTCSNISVDIDGTNLADVFGTSPENFEYQYQFSVDGGTYTDIEAPVGINFFLQNTFNVEGNYSFRRIITNGSCTDTSNVVSLEIIDQEISDNVLTFENGDSISYAVCETLSPEEIVITGSDAVSSSSSPINYQYVIYNEDSARFVEIEGATSRDYTFSTDTTPGTYTIGRYAASDIRPECADLYTVDVRIDSQEIENNTIATNYEVICTGLDVTIMGSEPTADGSFTYAYYDSIPGGTWNLIADSDDQNLTYTSASDTVYIRREVMVDGSDNVCMSISNTLMIVTDTTTPTAMFDFVPIGGGFCEGVLIQFSDSTLESDSITMYEWDLAGMATSTEADTVYAFQDGTYNITLEVTNNIGCTDDTTRELTILENPTVDAGQDNRITAGQTVQLEGSTTATIDSVYWTPADGLSDADILNPVASIENDQNYVLTVVDQNGCTATDTVFIDVRTVCDGIDSVNQITADVEEATCSGATVEVEALAMDESLDSASFTYQYQLTNDGVWRDIEEGDGFNFEGDITTTGEVMFRRIVSTGDECSDTSNISTVTVPDYNVVNNTLSFTNGDTALYAFCDNAGISTVEVIGSEASTSTNETIAYQYAMYYESVGVFATIEDATSQNFTFNADTIPGTYWIGRYAFPEDDPTCSTLDSIMIRIDEPVENTITTQNLRSCNGASLTVSGSVLDADRSTYTFTYYDSIPGGMWMPITDSDVDELMYDLDGEDTVYIVREIVFDDSINTCASLSNELMLVAEESDLMAMFDVSAADGFCADYDVMFTDQTSSTDTIVEWEWTYMGSEFSSDSDAVYNFESGSHDITLMVTNSLGCTDDTTMSITVFNDPDVEAGTNVKVNQGDEGRLSAVYDVDAIVNVNWSPAQYLSDPSSASTNFNVNSDQIFTVMVEDTNGCEAYDSVQVTINDEFFIPSAFTPNGDGSNDDFEIVGISQYPNSNIVIYNRWGIEIFRSDDLINNRWDGTSNGNMATAGAYFYVLDLGDDSGLKEGTITILK